jgi:hypothetical protein
VGRLTTRSFKSKIFGNMNIQDKYIQDRINYLKKIEMDYFDSSCEPGLNSLLKKQYRQFSNEFHARRSELEIFQQWAERGRNERSE